MMKSGWLKLQSGPESQTQFTPWAEKTESFCSFTENSPPFNFSITVTNYFGVALMVMWEVFISKDKAVKYIKTHL